MRLLDMSIQYAEDVITGKELAPEEVKIQCEWFLRDLEREERRLSLLSFYETPKDS